MAVPAGAVGGVAGAPASTGGATDASGSRETGRATGSETGKGGGGETLPGAGIWPPLEPPLGTLVAAGLRTGRGAAAESAVAKSPRLAPGEVELAEAPPACVASLAGAASLLV
jgi:hypothetical protein